VSDRPIITLTTDFGLRDPYVGAMKGVIASIAPGASVFDISHDVAPQDIEGGAFLIAAACPYYPSHAVHVGVVDPGVGTDRRPVAIATKRGTFVGPDNGLFSRVLLELGEAEVIDATLRGARAFQLSDPGFHLPDVSATFHGRDIFAPVAAHLAVGVPPEDVGVALQELSLGPLSIPEKSEGVVIGRITHVDRFGNAITNISSDLLPVRALIEVGGVVLQGIARTYQDGDLVALVGSAGVLEVAAREDSAARILRLHPGDPCVVRTAV